jgi:hypothetical protein
MAAAGDGRFHAVRIDNRTGTQQVGPRGSRIRVGALLIAEPAGVTLARKPLRAYDADEYVRPSFTSEITMHTLKPHSA